MAIKSVPTRKSVLPTTPVTYAEGNGAHLGEATNKSSTFRAYALDNMSRPLVTRETFAQYKSASDMEQNRLKRINGWFIRCGIEGKGRSKNTVTPSQMITLDVDNATPAFQEALLAGEIMPGIALAANTTRSHTPENPRFRMALPVYPPIPPDDYQRACRICALQFDPELKIVDKVSARPAQLMYRPSCSQDMEKHFRYHEQAGEVFLWQDAVAEWERETGLDSNVLSNLPRFYNEADLREAAEKAEDPLTKKGPVGAFCRAYSITELVEGKDGEDPILDGIYQIDDWEKGAAARMTYVAGHSQNGAVVYDDKFVYSHHGSDPASDQLCNAWDLVRYHLCDAKDDDPEAPMAKRESWKKMLELAKGCRPYQTEMRRERYDLADALTADDLDEDDMGWVEGETAEDLLGFPLKDEDEAEDLLGFEVDTWNYENPADIQTSLHEGYEPVYRRKRAEKPPKNWVTTQLDATPEGIIRNNTLNVMTIIANDPRTHQKIAFNEFTQEEVIIADIKYASPVVANAICENRHSGTRLNENHRDVLRAILQGPPRADNNGAPGAIGYGLPTTSDANIAAAVRNAAQLNKFNPLLDQIQIWRQMGPPEVDPIPDFLPRYLGTEKSVYTEQVARLMLIASIYRATTPGLKFDFMCVLQGDGGIGKSTTIRLLYGDEYFGELSAATHDKRVIEEETRGKWGLEMSEMDAFNKSDSASMKSFLRRQNDDVRRVFRTDPEIVPRRFVVWGTINKKVFLKDDTGNRSYWVVECGDQQADLTGFREMRELIWRQAVYDHDQMRAKTPHGNLPLYLTGEALKAAERLQEKSRVEEPWEGWFSLIEEWFETPIVLGTLLHQMGVEIDELDEDFEQKVLPAAITQEMATALLNNTGTSKLPGAQQNQSWANVVAEMEKAGWGVPRIPNGKNAGKRTTTRAAGKVGKWIFYLDMTEEERMRGYRPFGEGEAPNDSPPDDGDSLI